jgi:hypothetical protein
MQAVSRLIGIITFVLIISLFIGWSLLPTWQIEISPSQRVNVRITTTSDLNDFALYSETISGKTIFNLLKLQNQSISIDNGEPKDALVKVTAYRNGIVAFEDERLVKWQALGDEWMISCNEFRCHG